LRSSSTFWGNDPNFKAMWLNFEVILLIFRLWFNNLTLCYQIWGLHSQFWGYVIKIEVTFPNFEVTSPKSMNLIPIIALHTPRTNSIHHSNSKLIYLMKKFLTFNDFDEMMEIFFRIFFLLWLSFLFCKFKSELFFSLISVLCYGETWQR